MYAQPSSPILLVEDEESIREIECLYLKRAGFAVVETGNGTEALTLWRQRQPQLVVLDLNLPGQDGVAVCREIRRTSVVPIIMVTARVEEIDELLGLEVGADDYLKKPFSPAILVARVKALLRRHEDQTLHFADLQINPAALTVTVQGREKQLTTTQFNILYSLAQRPGRVFTRSEILDRAYPGEEGSDIFDRTIDAHIKTIRRQLEDDPRNPRYIRTVVGSGYVFNKQT